MSLRNQTIMVHGASRFKVVTDRQEGIAKVMVYDGEEEANANMTLVVFFDGPLVDEEVEL